MRVRTASWYETRIKYQKTMEDGSEKVVNELYVVDALSCTEAETSIIDEMSCYISGDSAVTSAKKTNYGEIFFSDLIDDDKWYKAKLQFITIDEKSEKEKDNNHLRRYLRHYLCNRGIPFPSQRKRVSRRRVFRIVFRAE